MKTQFFGFLSFVVVSVFATTTKMYANRFLTQRRRDAEVRGGYGAEKLHFFNLCGALRLCASALMAAAALIFPPTAFSQAVSNEVLFVDQAGNVSRPEVLATAADMAANKAAILTAEQKAAAAQAAAREGTNLIQDVIRDITANELVVYRHGYTDAFGVVVVIDPDAKLVICEFKPLDEVDSAGRHMFSLRYALQNSRAVDAKPEVRWHSSIVGGRDSFAALPADQVQSPVSAGSWENPATGEVYPYSYTIRFSAPTDKSGFFIVNLTADDASGDGWTFDLPNGVTGGFSGDVPFGSKTLRFAGGILLEVK